MAGEIPASVGVPALRCVEGDVIDPDGHVIAFFQYDPPGPEWDEVLEERGGDVQRERSARK